ncbi:unnamed protein product [Paramecium primaurelia]|uniref:Armadillo-type fold n=1 Tax=Paramecium primaurelia TaxID=5886 RepID=A0A8S1L720_PARPR|nr:unnamed protein product [Paramecium primaurelia]
MDQLYSKIEELSKVGFPTSKLKELYQTHQISDLLELLKQTQQNKDQLNKTIAYLDALFQDSDIYKELLLKENSFEFVQTLLTHQNKKVRSLLSECIENNDFEFGQLISKLVQEKSPLLNLVLQVIFFQLSDPESEVGLKALRVIKKLFKFVDESLKILLSSDLFVTYITQGLNNKNEVIQLRFVEILIYITNLDQSIQQPYINLFTIVFKLYNTDDILVKLNMIELIADMGNSKWNSEQMVNQSFFKNILNSAFNSNDDFYTQKYEVLLVARMLSQRVIKFTPILEKNLIKLLSQWLSTNSSEQIEGAIEIISSFVKFTEGFNAIIKNTDFLVLFFQYLYSTKDVIKLKAINCYVSFFVVDSTTPKPPGKILWIYSLFGNVSKTLSQFHSNDSVSEATVYLIKQLNTPFGEVEKTILELTMNLLEWDEIFTNIIANQSLLVYFSKISQNKEIFDSKNRVKQQIINLCTNKYKAPEYQEYAKTLQNLTLQKDMQYASNVQ